MNKAGIDRIEGTVLVTLNPDGTFSNVRVKDVTPGNMRSAVQRTFAGPLTSDACRTDKSDLAQEIEIPFVMRLD
jgi:hypothetical protein